LRVNGVSIYSTILVDNITETRDTTPTTRWSAANHGDGFRFRQQSHTKMNKNNYQTKTMYARRKNKLAGLDESLEREHILTLQLSSAHPGW
jgi:hypothetical protein